MKEWNKITKLPIDPIKVLASVRDRSAGGIVVFVGTIRNRSEGRAVVGLEYEVYKVMAEKKMREISENAKKRWHVKRISMLHRYGPLQVGEISVAVAVSSEHRAEAFEACRYAIDTIKRALPIWKKEQFKGARGAWVKGTPIGS
jgi:molybdopterin synthase catalytic subunit